MTDDDFWSLYRQYRYALNQAMYPYRDLAWSPRELWQAALLGLWRAADKIRPEADPNMNFVFVRRVASRIIYREAVAAGLIFDPERGHVGQYTFLHETESLDAASEEDGDSLFNALPDPRASDPQQFALDRELVRHCAALLRKHSRKPQQYKAFFYRALFGFEPHEYAPALGLSPSAARMAARRGSEFLRSALVWD